MINNDSNVNGIYRAVIINRGTLKVYVPSIATFKLFENNSLTIIEEVYEKCKDTLPSAQWCVPNMEAMVCDEIHQCWVVFECGDYKRPIIMGFVGKGIKYHAITITADSSGGTGDGGTNENQEDANLTYTGGSDSDWLNSVAGTSAKEHGSGTGTQCVELPNAYLESMGIKNYGGYGNGNTYYSGVANAHPDKFSKITYTSGTTVKPGDIISLKGTQTQYGHAAVVKSVNGNNITIVEQWKGSGTVRESTFNVNDGGKRTILGIARPK